MGIQTRAHDFRKSPVKGSATMPRDVKRGTLRAYMGACLLALILVGFPIASQLGSLLSDDPATITHPYRIAVLGFALAIAATSFSLSSVERLPWALMLFFSIYLIRLLVDWSSLTDGAYDSLIFFLVLCVGPSLGVAMSDASILTERQIALTILSFVLPAMGLIVIGWRLGAGINPWGNDEIQVDRLFFAALNPISIANCGGIGVLTGLYLISRPRISAGVWTFSLTALLLGGLVLLLGNSRGPFVAVTAAAAFFFLQTRRRLLLTLPLFAISIFLLVQTQGSLVGSALARFAGLGNQALDPSGHERLILQQQAIDAFLANPAFGSFYRHPDAIRGQYPHNVIIETAMALGCLGLSVVALLVWSTMERVRRSILREHPLVSTLLVQQFIQACISGSIFGCDALFALTAFCLSARPVTNVGRLSRTSTSNVAS